MARSGWWDSQSQKGMRGHIIAFALFLCVVGSGLAKQLVQTNIVFRHGDRAPIEIYPNDKHKAEKWPNGLGMLTQRGKEQQTRLGIFLRNRYKDFISDTFKTDEVYVQSSDTDRTLVSAYSNLAGLFSKDDAIKWNGDSIRWRPVPVHSIPVEYDQYIKQTRRCSRYESLYNDTVEVEKKEVEGQLSDMIKVVNRLAGYSGDSLNWQVGDTLVCEKYHDMEAPAWADWTNMTCSKQSPIECTNRTVYDILVDFHQYYYVLRDRPKSIQEFQGGPLVMKILDNFNSIIKGKTPRMYLYSGHDSTIATVLSALGAFNNKVPECASALMIELYTDDGDDDFLVEVNFKNITDNNTVFSIPLPACGANQCTLKNFTRAYKHLRITDWNRDCHNDYKSLTEEEIVTVSICMAVVVALILATVICYARRKRISHSYVRVQS